MLASRGMGAINPSKMPKGSKVKKMAEGDLVDDVNVKPNYAVLNPDFKAAGARFSAKKALDKNSDIEAYMDLSAEKAKGQDLKAKPGKVGFVYNKRFADGGEVWDQPRPKGLGKPKQLTSAKKSAAKKAAKSAGRPYPNLVDNMRAARKK